MSITSIGNDWSDPTRVLGGTDPVSNAITPIAEVEAVIKIGTEVSVAMFVCPDCEPWPAEKSFTGPQKPYSGLHPRPQ